MAGTFIVFEGIDGSGTTTQAKRMYDALAAQGQAVHLTQEPSGGPVGGMIRLMLQKRLVGLGGGMSDRTPRWNTMGLLFAADRLDHLENEIDPNLRDGISIVCDRYLHSSLVYQSVTSSDKDATMWLKEINRFARQPDVVFFLDVKAELAHKRMMETRTVYEMYDDLELQRSLASQYKEILGTMETKLVMIDGSGTESDVHATCMEKLKELGMPIRG